MHNQHKTLIQDPESESSFMTPTPSKRPALMTATTRQVNPVHVHEFPVQNTSQSGLQHPVHMSTSHRIRFANQENW